jgi:3-hydroxyisobutyrate dehydrogenase-like beta-hydroxyacid dehydrogenase
MGYPSELGRKCNFVIISVTDGQAVKEMLFGDNGLVNSNNKRLIVVDTSTILPDDSIYCASLMKKKRIRNSTGSNHGRTRCNKEGRCDNYRFW